MTIPGKLSVDRTGRITGPISIEYNSPFPVANGTPGAGSPRMMGVVMHTMVGDLASADATFNNPASQVSAFFGIGQDGHVKQWGPVGRNWMAWAQMAGNAQWYSIEHADHGNPDNPLTPAQITASAQLVECLSAFAGFPLAVTDSPHIKGYGTHSMGGAAWGGHTCPDLPPLHIRSAQRQAIIDLAKQIRNPPLPVPVLEAMLVVLPGGAARKVLSRDGGRTWA